MEKRKNKESNKLYEGTHGETGKTRNQTNCMRDPWRNGKTRNQTNCMRVPMEKRKNKESNKLYEGTHGETEKQGIKQTV